MCPPWVRRCHDASTAEHWPTRCTNDRTRRLIVLLSSPLSKRSTLGSAFNPFVISYARRKLPEQSRSALNATGYGRLCNSAQDTVVSRDSSVCIAYLSLEMWQCLSSHRSYRGIIKITRRGRKREDDLCFEYWNARVFAKELETG